MNESVFPDFNKSNCFSITHVQSGAVLAGNGRIARGFWARFIGLLGRKRLCSGEALVIERCSQVHTFFMQFAIDVIFCSEDFTVLDTNLDLAPWCISKCLSSAAYTVEVQAGTLIKTGVFTGDTLKFS